jgi:hypothetical protein
MEYSRRKLFLSAPFWELQILQKLADYTEFIQSYFIKFILKYFSSRE